MLLPSPVGEKSLTLMFCIFPAAWMGKGKMYTQLHIYNAIFSSIMMYFTL